jgi:hypothetical protein
MTELTPTDSPKKKPRRNTTAAQRRARDRLGKILAGAIALHKQNVLRGPIAFDYLHGLIEQFDSLVDGALQSGTDTALGGEVLATLTGEARAVVDAVQEYAEVYYPHGTEGRAAFFVPGGGQKALDDELAACNAGLKRDAAGDHLLADLPGTDLAANAQLLIDLRQAQKAVDSHDTLLENTRDTRARVGETIRKILVPVEKLVRRIHKGDAVALLKYGMKPRGQFSVAPAPRKPPRKDPSAAKPGKTKGPAHDAQA